MEIATIQNLLEKQNAIVNEKRVVLQKFYDDATADLTSLMKDMGFPECEVKWETERTKFMMPRPNTSWTLDIDIYTYAKHVTYEKDEVPTVTPKISWFSSDATAEDEHMLNYLTLLGKLANDLKSGGIVINMIMNKITTFNQYKHDLGWEDALHTESQLERELKDAKEAEKIDAADAAIYQGAEFLVLKTFNQGRRFCPRKDTALKITKIGRKNLHVISGYKYAWKKERSMEINWDEYSDTYLSIDTLRYYIKEGYLLPC